MLACSPLRAVLPARAAARRSALRVRASAEPGEAATPAAAAAATAVPPTDAPAAPRPAKKLVETPVRARSAAAERNRAARGCSAPRAL